MSGDIGFERVTGTAVWDSLLFFVWYSAHALGRNGATRVCWEGLFGGSSLEAVAVGRSLVLLKGERIRGTAV